MKIPKLTSMGWSYWNEIWNNSINIYTFRRLKKNLDLNINEKVNELRVN